MLKQALRNPIIRAIVQIVGCAAMAGPTFGAGAAGCAALAGALTMASGGSVVDALKAFAFSFAQMGIFSGVGPYLNAIQGADFLGGTLLKAGVHGVIGGAVSVAHGGSFLQGFASNAIGALGGFAGEAALGANGSGGFEGMLARTAVAAAAGCGGAVYNRYAYDKEKREALAAWEACLGGLLDRQSSRSG